MLNYWAYSRSMFKHNMDDHAFGTRLRYEMGDLLQSLEIPEY